MQSISLPKFVEKRKRIDLLSITCFIVSYRSIALLPSELLVSRDDKCLNDNVISNLENILIIPILFLCKDFPNSIYGQFFQTFLYLHSVSGAILIFYTYILLFPHYLPW